MKNPDKRLLRAVDLQLRASRYCLESMGFCEILAPCLLGQLSAPFPNRFTFEGGKLKGTLTQSATAALTSACRVVDAAYAFTPSFRPNDLEGTNHLVEFHYMQTQFPGGIEVCITKAEQILEHIICTFRGDLYGSDISHLEKIHFPLRRLSYKEAIECVGCNFGTDIDSDIANRLLSQFDNHPLIVTSIPRRLRPFEFDLRGEDNGTLSFEICAPFSGEIMSGGELETDKIVLNRQIGHSEVIRVAREVGWDAESLKDWVENLAALPGPYASFSLGFERLTQFLLGQKSIHDATTFPNPVDRSQLSLQIGEASRK